MDDKSKMENKLVYKYIGIRVICIIIIYILGSLIVPYTPNIKIVRIIEFVLMLIIVAISFYVIGRCQKRAIKDIE